MREVARRYTRAQRAVADCCGATSTQCHILTELARSGPIPMSELGARLLLEKSWISRAIDKLVSEGFVVKAENPQDARSWLVSLSRSGRSRAAALNATLDQHASQLLAPLKASERAAIGRALERLLQVLRDDTQTDQETNTRCRP